MALTALDFKNAFREAVSSEFYNIPQNENEIICTFSPEFENKMNKLINFQKKSYWKYTNTIGKRIAVIAIALLILFSTACSIKPIREPIVNFITEVYDTFNQYFFNGNTTETLEQEYKITLLPDGFVQTNQLKDFNSVTTTYQNPDGDIIELWQITTENTQLNIDTEKNNKQTKMIDGISVDIYENNYSKTAIWTKNGYAFTLICIGNFESSDMENLILSIK